MEPWSRRAVRRASLPVTFASLAMGIVVACVTVSSGAPGARQAAADVVDPTSAPTAASLAAPTSTPTLTPTLDPSMPPGGAPASPSPVASVAEVVASTATSGGSLGEATQRRLDRILRDMVKTKDIAGLQVAVRMADGRTWVGTAGNAEFSPARKIEDDTVFAIASVTKTFIAALILKLAEEGKLSLDEPFGTYLPDVPRGRIVTVRQLLGHRSGIYNYFSHPRYGNAARAWLRQGPSPGLLDRGHRWTFDEIMSLVRNNYCQPGSCYRYSNTNYVILGKVAEAAGGAPIHRQLRRTFFRPLGLDDTFYQPAEKPPLDAAHGHWIDGAGYDDHTRGSRVIPFMAAISVADAAGAIASTAEDLVVWADALYGGEILGKSSLRQMTTIHPEGTYGLGTDVAFLEGHRAFGHRGGLRGYEASMWYFPKSGVSIALLSNQGNWVTDNPMRRIVKSVLGKA